MRACRVPAVGAAGLLRAVSSLSMPSDAADDPEDVDHRPPGDPHHPPPPALPTPHLTHPYMRFPSSDPQIPSPDPHNRSKTTSVSQIPGPRHCLMSQTDPHPHQKLQTAPPHTTNGRTTPVRSPKEPSRHYPHHRAHTHAHLPACTHALNNPLSL